VTVWLVGAGPGDPGLITAKGLELVRSCEALVYDVLVAPELVAEAPDDALLIPRAKLKQAEINKLLVELGQRGLEVVRLKGGDPFVFGRGGEEAQLLRAAGIAFEIVPGITAGISAPAYAGIPVTHRDFASGVAFVTGHEDGTLDWEALARFPGTLVFYMGVKALPRIAARLVEGGRPASQPVAVVERGTLPGQKTVVSTLDSIVEDAAGIRAPAITLVGDVAGLRSEIAWLESRPLFGKSVAVTRARAQASALAARLRGLGASVVEAPAIRTQSLAVELPPLNRYDLLCVTSPNGASELFRHLRDARELAGIKVAAMGPGTARALREHGVEADIVPERAVAEGLVDALADVPVERALIARAAEGRDVLIDALRERGVEVDVVALYETVAEPLENAEAVAAADYLLFTSGSSVRFYAEAGGSLSGPRLVSIGPATSDVLREHGAEPDLEADPHTPDGLVAALLVDAS